MPLWRDDEIQVVRAILYGTFTVCTGCNLFEKTQCRLNLYLKWSKMKKAQIIYTEKDEIQGYFPKGRDSVFYECTLTVTDKKTKPVTLELNITIHNYVFEFPEKKIFTGDSVSEVYGKLSKWFASYGFVFKY